MGSNLRHFGFVTSGFRGETVSGAAPPSPCASLQPLCIQRDGSYVVQPRRDLVLHVLAGDASRGITGNNQKREFSQKFVGLIVNHKAAINLRVGTQVRGDGLKWLSFRSASTLQARAGAPEVSVVELKQGNIPP